MTKYYQLGGVDVPYLSSYISGTALHPGTGTSIGTAPTGCQAAFITADGAAYYAVNGTAAGTNSSGYIPSGGVRMVPNIDNFSTISFTASAGVTVYIQYYGNIV